MATREDVYRRMIVRYTRSGRNPRDAAATLREIVRIFSTADNVASALVYNGFSTRASADRDARALASMVGEPWPTPS